MSRLTRLCCLPMGGCYPFGREQTARTNPGMIATSSRCQHNRCVDCRMWEKLRDIFKKRPAHLSYRRTSPCRTCLVPPASLSVSCVRSPSHAWGALASPLVEVGVALRHRPHLRQSATSFFTTNPFQPAAAWHARVAIRRSRETPTPPVPCCPLVDPISINKVFAAVPACPTTTAIPHST